MERDLPSHLAYHTAAHTTDDVVPAAMRLADAEALSGRDRLILLTAAWFHDVGYTVRTTGHEAVSIEFADRELPTLGYGPEDVAAVTDLIRATQMPQRPESHLAGLLADADLDVLGRLDFLESNGRLRRELAALGRVYGDADWYDEQIAFVAAHRYHTSTARALRDETKARNLDRLRELRSAAQPFRVLRRRFGIRRRADVRSTLHGTPNEI